MGRTIDGNLSNGFWVVHVGRIFLARDDEVSKWVLNVMREEEII